MKNKTLIQMSLICSGFFVTACGNNKTDPPSPDKNPTEQTPASTTGPTDPPSNEKYTEAVAAINALGNLSQAQKDKFLARLLKSKDKVNAIANILTEAKDKNTKMELVDIEEISDITTKNRLKKIKNLEEQQIAIKIMKALQKNFYTDEIQLNHIYTKSDLLEDDEVDPDFTRIKESLTNLNDNKSLYFLINDKALHIWYGTDNNGDGTYVLSAVGGSGYAICNEHKSAQECRDELSSMSADKFAEKLMSSYNRIK